MQSSAYEWPWSSSIFFQTLNEFPFICFVHKSRPRFTNNDKHLRGERVPCPSPLVGKNFSPGNHLGELGKKQWASIIWSYPLKFNQNLVVLKYQVEIPTLLYYNLFLYPFLRWTNLFGVQFVNLVNEFMYYYNIVSNVSIDHKSTLIRRDDVMKHEIEFVGHEFWDIL